MQTPPSIDSSLLRRSIAQWEALLKCHQCHRVVESITELWEGPNSDSLCSSCCHNCDNSKSIFACVNGPLTAIDHPNASDPGKVVQLLKGLLIAYQQRTENTKQTQLHSADPHSNENSHPSTQIHIISRGKPKLPKVAQQSIQQLPVAEPLSTESSVETTNHGPVHLHLQPQPSTFNSHKPTIQPEFSQDRILYPTYCQGNRASSLSSDVSGLSQATPLNHQSQSSQFISQQESTMSLPETADFETVFPGPQNTKIQVDHTQSPSGDNVGCCLPCDPRHMPNSLNDDQTQLPSQSSELLCPKDIQQPRNNMLPETADFETVLSPARACTKDDDSTILLEDEGEDDLELPSTEDFDKIFPPVVRTLTNMDLTANVKSSRVNIHNRQNNADVSSYSTRPIKPPLYTHQHGNNDNNQLSYLQNYLHQSAKEESGQCEKDQATESLDFSPLTESHNIVVDHHTLPLRSKKMNKATSLGIVTPASFDKTANPTTKHGKSPGIEDQQSLCLPIVTPILQGKNKRRKGSSVCTDTEFNLDRTNGNENHDKNWELCTHEGPINSAVQSPNTILTFPSVPRKHPFETSNPRKVHICARTFQYLLARANQWTIQGQGGETVWGDSELYNQSLAVLKGTTNKQQGWICKTPWWGTASHSPCATRIPRGNRKRPNSPPQLLADYTILVVPNDFSEVSTIRFDFSSLPSQGCIGSLGHHHLDYDSLSVEQIKRICSAAGASLIESISFKELCNENFVILVAEEIDEELFQNIVFPHLVRCGILPSQIKYYVPSVQVHKSQSRARVNAPILYFSWLVESIAANMIAPTSLYCLGTIGPDSQNLTGES